MRSRKKGCESVASSIWGSRIVRPPGCRAATAHDFRSACRELADLMFGLPSGEYSVRFVVTKPGRYSFPALPDDEARPKS
jgi:hypothetical protein